MGGKFLAASKWENILPMNGEAYLLSDMLSGKDLPCVFAALQDEIFWREEAISLFGKKVLQPRLTAWCGDPNITYRYSGITMHPQPWTKTLARLKEKAEEIAGVTFNGALLNQYRNGKDSMGWHRDNETELGLCPVIASLSFGGAREFQFRHRIFQKQKISLKLSSGSLLLMRGETQEFWDHCVPKTRREVEARINITFRAIVPLVGKKNPGARP